MGSGRAFVRRVAHPVVRNQARLASTAQGQAIKKFINHGDDTPGLSCKDYSKTLHLPRPPIPPYAKVTEIAEAYSERTTAALYRQQWEERKDKEFFILHDGPPYANGHLHIGHAVNKILKDIINRFQLLQGKRVHYSAGWDCHGLPIENKALVGLDPSASPTKIRQVSRHYASVSVNIQRREFEQMKILADFSDPWTYRTYDKEYEIRQLRVFQQMVKKGLIVRRYRPIWWSPASGTALAEGELVYDDSHKSKSVYVKFPIKREDMSPELRKGFDSTLLEDLNFLVWTTTPWTLPSNMAVAINEEIDYVIARGEHNIIIAADAVEPLPDKMGTSLGSDILGTKYHHYYQKPDAPPNPVFSARWVKADSGTGVVHCAPGHGADDYFTMTSAGLLEDHPLVSPVDGKGEYTEDILGHVPHSRLGGSLIGRSVQDKGNEEVLRQLREAGRSIHVKQIKHKYPYDWKTKTPVITRATSQWFASIADVKEKALKVLENVKFHPEAGRARLESFIRERSEWCISRQRNWGVPIPALHDIATDEAYLSAESLDHIIPVLEKHGIDYWWEGPVEDFIPPHLQGKNLRKGTDTMDVWFDSGSSWSLLGNLHGEKQEGGPRISDVCLEGSDQHRGWFQSLLLTRIIAAAEGEETAPYKTVITHGFVLDEHGRKMSKSDGNVISPLAVINGTEQKSKLPVYGADVLRLWTASADYTDDMAIGQNILKQSAESYRKLRNSARFMLGVLAIPNKGPVDQLQSTKPGMGLIERWIMDRLYQTERTCREAYERYQFHRVVHALTDFSTISLSAQYFSFRKDAIYCDAQDQTRAAIVTVMKNLLHVYKGLLAPILPLVAEEIHEAEQKIIRASQVSRAEELTLEKRLNKESVFMQPWPVVDSAWEDTEARETMEILLAIRSSVLGLLEKARAGKGLGSSDEAVVYLADASSGAAPHHVFQLLQTHEPLLSTVFGTSYAWTTSQIPNNTDQNAWEFTDNIEISQCPLTITVRGSPKTKCPRCWKWTKPSKDALCERCTKALM
ncbi:mitochondrial isoleucyl-tRNA synthetase [Dacryopinax primogenitus]|uniref:isoleucine--tRNA ligase n=1 Tax=Dacryopinax primogenitus (strain DJM 731) TaxID=1858805 RepID=M5FTB3_DACPD|nr:mitochondrial isoleucyl-tRNA synthetase [Dacryopinax primogenitus]EJT99273.1 mitochondrial isoleucyl-tRNA synthetase [Dacryopinax primogenitus]